MCILCDVSPIFFLRERQATAQSSDHKTVLLRERKRHTDRLSSTPCAVLYRAGGRVPRAGAPPGWGTPYPDLARGVPRAGAPLAGVPLILTWLTGYSGQVPPWLWYSPILTWPGGTPGRCPPGWDTPILTWLGNPPS